LDLYRSRSLSLRSLSTGRYDKRSDKNFITPKDELFKIDNIQRLSDYFDHDFAKLKRCYSLLRVPTLHIPATISQLIHSVYHGVLEDEPWNIFLNQLNQLFQSDMAVLLVVPRQQQSGKYLLNRVVNTGVNIPETSHHWIALDPFQDIPDDTPMLLDDLDEQHTIEKSSFYQNLIKPSGIRYILAINIPAKNTPDLILKLRIARYSGKDNFDADDKETISILVEHIKLALQFLDQMAIQQIERNAFADAINQFMLGTLILDRSGKIVASNRVARDTIEQYQALKIQQGALVIVDKKTNQQLYSALANIEDSNDPVPLTITVALNDSLALGLTVRPVRPDDALTHPVHAHAVVFISDPQGVRGISPETLKDLFGFTGSESKVAAYLANGHTLMEAADALSISVNTAKSHARNIYEKTGVNKQTKFIQLVSNSVARVS
jgi:DNA-binding CsgD family transcriptional regulator